MNAVTGFLKRGEEPLEAEQAKAAVADRNAGHMIAGCEYELRQVLRDIQATRPQTPAMRDALREPFVLGARLRNEAFRANLAQASGPRGPEEGGGGQ